MSKHEIKKRAKIDAIRSVWKPGICSREIAEALGISKSSVCGTYYCQPEELKDFPLRSPGSDKGENRPRPLRANNHISKWTPELIAKVADLMEKGKTYQEIGTALRVTRNTISGVIDRTPELRAMKTGRSRPKMSEEERRIRQQEARLRYEASVQRKRQFMPRMIPPRQPFKPVVHTNVAMMVQDWIAANGVRKFETGASSEYFSLARYLEERGYQFTTHYARFKLTGPSGRSRIVEFREAVEVADRFRRAEGLEPFLAA